MTRSLGPVVVVAAAGAAHAHVTGVPGDDGVITQLGRFHPTLVHFPVALVIGAAVAELLYMFRANQYYGNAARFMINLAALFSVLAATAGFMAAAGKSYSGDLAGVLDVHRVGGVVTPVLVLLACGLSEGTRRSGQIWEQILFRIVLLLAVVSVGVTAQHGGELVYGAGYFSW